MKEDMTIKSPLPLIVDQLVICVQIPSKSLHQAMASKVFELKSIKNSLNEKAMIKVAQKSGLTRLNYYPENGRQMATIELGISKSSRRYFRLSLWPSKFQGDEFNEFKAFLGQNFPPINYEDLYHSGTVTRLDLAVDWPFHGKNDLIPFRPKANKSRVYDGWKPIKGSVYLGSATSQLQFCIYDKAKQLIETSGHSQYPVLTRLEARLRRLGMPAAKLHDGVKNPFLSLEIADAALAGKIGKAEGFSDFLWQCRTYGSARSLHIQPSKSKRKKQLTRLREARATWWHPEKCWPEYEEALKVIAP